MKNVAFIPVRGGSKSIKSKNIMQLGAHPLVYYVVKAASEAENIDRVYVSTDSDLIAKTVNSFGLRNVSVISRTPETATDTSTSESALIEFCKNYEFERVVFLQATSPLTKPADIESALDILAKSGSQSLISVVKRYQFLWDTCGNPVNYNPCKRPRRQDWEGYYVENGAFYISSRENILESKCRISGSVSYYEMPQATLFEVDEPEDWGVIEKFML